MVPVQGATVVAVNVAARQWTVGTITLSGLEALPSGPPRATILALHGGGYTAKYWDHPLDDGASLLRIGADLGYRVIALDRPGYGASFGLIGEAVRAVAQARVLADFVVGLGDDTTRGAGVFAVGHSQGSVVAMHLATVVDCPSLLGMELAGLPLRFKEGLVDTAALAALDHLPLSAWEGRRLMFFGPDGTFDPGMSAAEATTAAPVPAAEIIDAVGTPVWMPELAPRVRIPVQYTVAEYEQSSDSDASVLDEVRNLYRACPRLLTQWQVATGHNISLHHVARAYHLRAVAFFDEVLAAQGA